MKQVGMTFWAWLDNNKSIICFAIPALLQKAIDMELLQNNKIIEFITWAFLSLSTGALYHHYKKGHFSSRKI